MADPSVPRPRTQTPKVALPRIPPWKAPTPAAVAKAAEAQRERNERSISSSSEPAPVSSSAIDIKDLATRVGERIQITNILSRTLTGTIYSIDDSELVLSTGTTDYHLIPTSKIKQYDILAPENLAPKSIDTAAKEKAIRLAEEREKKLVRPQGVSVVGHALFISLEKTLPVRWNGSKIVVLDNVTIEPPYDAEDCKAPAKHGKQLERVKELVRREREKVAGRRGG